MVDDPVRVVVHDEVEAADLVGPHAGLRDEDPIHLGRFLEDRVRVPAEDQVDAPLRPEETGELEVRLEADVGQEDRQVDVVVLVGVGDAPYLGARLLQGDETRDLVVLP